MEAQLEAVMVRIENVVGIDKSQQQKQQQQDLSIESRIRRVLDILEPQYYPQLQSQSQSTENQTNSNENGGNKVAAAPVYIDTNQTTGPSNNSSPAMPTTTAKSKNNGGCCMIS